VLTLNLHLDPIMDKDQDIKTLINKFWWFGGK
jgi:hypothetical protein